MGCEGDMTAARYAEGRSKFISAGAPWVGRADRKFRRCRVITRSSHKFDAGLGRAEGGGHLLLRSSDFCYESFKKSRGGCSGEGHVSADQKLPKIGSTFIAAGCKAQFTGVSLGLSETAP